MMKTPRRPRNEPPTTTIRYLRRQIENMEISLHAARLAAADKDTVIAGFDVQLSEADDQIKSLQHRNAEQAFILGETRSRNRMTAERLAYLEGYFYAKEKEAPINQTFPAIPAAGPFISRNTAETDARPGSRDTESVQIRRQTAEDARRPSGTERYEAAAGDEIRSVRRDHQAHPPGDKVEHVEITEWRDRPPSRPFRDWGVA